MMEELKAQEAEALDIIESLLDVADMKCTGPLYADDPPRSGMCRIPENDATELRQYIAARRAASENNPLTLDELLSMDGEPVWSYWASWVIVNVVSKSNVEFVYRDGSKNDYEELVELGMTPVLYKQIPEGNPKCKTNTKGTKINSAACKVLQAWAKSLEYSEPEESEN